MAPQPADFVGRPLDELIAMLTEQGEQLAQSLPAAGLPEYRGMVRVRGTTLDPCSLRPTDLMTTVAEEHHAPEQEQVELPDVVLETLLGRGRQGCVYAGRVLSSGKLVAVKVLNQLEGQGANSAAREALLCARIRHPSVLRVFHVQPAGRAWVVVMELISGSELGEMNMAVSELRCCLQQLADALCELGRKHVVHRDIKPANILIRERDRSPVLVDFGLAVDLMEQEPPALGISGTPLFMAPEVFAGGQPEPSWDAYALGVTAAFMLSPKLRRFSSVHEVGEAKRSGAFDAQLTELLRDCPDADLRNWVTELIARQPERRLAAIEAAREWHIG